MTLHPAEKSRPGDIEQPCGLGSIAARFTKCIEQPHPFVFESFLLDRFQRFRRVLPLPGRGLRG